MIKMDTINSNDNPKEAAVTVKNAFKRYSDSNVVLNGLNMTVKEGTIYGLLGPSGCGKTTLLHCILGKNELDGGMIKVKAKTNADIGYMPQEISLYNELTIEETLTFYGRLFGLSDREIEKRTDELLVFLDLPSKTRLVGGLSGGQCRRVSFAVALVHNPQLLILDEPTVGVDPVLCVSIWDKLLLMVQMENKTVIVTTHYIEETRRAHTIGLMRNGKLLAENSPTELMTLYNSSTLEDVFLQLCERQHSTSAVNQSNNNEIRGRFNSMSKNKSQVPLKQTPSCSWNIIFALLTKNYYWMKRNSTIILYVFLVPFVDCMIYSMCIGNDPTELKLAVVNEEFPGISNCDSLQLDGCNFSIPFSCRYIKKLQQKTYEMVEYYDIDSGKNAVKKNKAWGLVHFPKNYTASMNERITLREKADDASLTFSEVQIWLDMSNQYIGNLLRRDTLKECFEYLRELFSECEWPPHLAELPIKIEDAVYGSNNPKFRHSTSSSVISLFHFHLPMLFTAGAVLMEKMSGSLSRSLISGVTMLEIAISLIIIQFVILCIQCTTMVLTLFVLYDNPLLVGNLLWIAILLLSTGVSAFFYGFLVAVMSNSHITATYICVGSTFGFFTMCGVLWPLEGMHWILKPFSYILPITRCAEAFRALSVKDYPLSNPIVYQGFFSSILWSCFFVSITTIILKKNKGLGNN
ncbi:ABC transporter G family member 23-like isoform X2 [Planococcus citri]|uniref:ABC transporter G family member 23-like isoform X2 n=1 Tax=Planococcus citri TaxID=170843 RepID=UPI0031F85F86